MNYSEYANSDDWSADEWEGFFSEPEELDQNQTVLLEDLYQEDIHQTEINTAPNSLPTTWHYDNTGYYAYVLLDATSEQCNNVKQILIENGFECPLSGESNRAADNGVKYKRYIRILDKAGNHPEPDSLTHILRKIIKSPASIDSDNRIYTLERNLNAEKMQKNQLAEEVRKTEQKLHSIQNEKTVLLQKIEELSQSNGKLSTNTSNMKEEINELWDRIKWHSRRLKEAETVFGSQEKEIEQFAALKSENENLNIENSKLRREWSNDKESLKYMTKMCEEYNSELDEEKQRAQDAINKRDITKAILEKAKQKIIELRSQSQNDERQKAPSSDESLISELVTSLLPKLEFNKPSICVMARELKDRTDVLNQLSMINNNPASLNRVKTIQGAKPWRELHYRTGHDNSGRLYFLKKDNGTYRVFISFKATQNIDITWLKNNCQ